MAAVAQRIFFDKMKEAELRQWVEAVPGWVNNTDHGCTPLYTAIVALKSLQLVLWLLDEKGADVNANDAFGLTPLHWAESLDILTDLLIHGADPTRRDIYQRFALIIYVAGWRFNLVAHLLQDTRVRATIDFQDSVGSTLFIAPASSATQG